MINMLEIIGLCAIIYVIMIVLSFVGFLAYFGDDKYGFGVFFALVCSFTWFISIPVIIIEEMKDKK